MRDLSGLYFRTKDPKTDKFINVCFEELPKDQIAAILVTESDEFKIRLINRLVDTINEIGEAMDAYREDEDI